jgi:protein gp37
MNKTRVDWATHSYNPVTGCLGPANDGQHCQYCYAKRITTRFAGGAAFPKGFAPTFHADRLRDPMLKTIPAGSRVFVGSMTDLGAPWAAEWLPRILGAVKERPDVTFIFLTKQPQGFADVLWWPDNCWVGMTYTGAGRAEGYLVFKYDVKAKVRFLSLEPLLGGELLNFLATNGRVRHAALDWLIIGAQTGPKAIAPKREWIETWVDIATRWSIPLFMKSNLRPHWDGEWRKEYPE